MPHSRGLKPGRAERKQIVGDLQGNPARLRQTASSGVVKNLASAGSDETPELA